MSDYILSSPILSSLIITFVIQIIFFIFAASFKTDKVTDLSYSLTFFILTGMFLILNRSLLTINQLIIGSVVLLWSIRLGTYLLTRILKMGRDKRFDSRREHVIEFMKFWIIQAFGVWFIMLPISLYLSKSVVNTNYLLFFIGLIISICGLTIETVSDYQKFIFKNNKLNSNRWIESGLWNYSRHPNYLGELMVWWGLFIAVVNNLRNWEFLVIWGPISITLLILFVTGLPPLEKNYDEKYKNNAAYERYKSTTNKLFFTIKKIKK